WLRPSKQIQPLIFSFKQPAQQRKIVATYELLYALLIGSLIALIVLPVNLFIIDGIKQCQSYTSTTACVNRKSISYAGVKPLKSNSCVNVCASSSNVPITAIDPVNVKIDITLNDQVNRALLELQVSKEDVYQSFCRKYQHHHHQLQQLVLGDIQVYPKKDTITFSSGLHSWASSLQQFSKHDQRTVPANNQYQDAIATKIQRFEQSLNNVLDDHYWSTFFFIDPSPIHPHSNLSIDYQSPKPNHISVSLRKKLKHWVTQMAGQLRHIRTWKSY
ncbi:hypothetical protein MJO28_017155, partial [Puccinia striiformis f. sp. tritici]